MKVDELALAAADAVTTLHLAEFLFRNVHGCTVCVCAKEPSVESSVEGHVSAKHNIDGCGDEFAHVGFK